MRRRLEMQKIRALTLTTGAPSAVINNNHKRVAYCPITEFPGAALMIALFLVVALDSSDAKPTDLKFGLTKRLHKDHFW